MDKAVFATAAGVAIGIGIAYSVYTWLPTAASWLVIYSTVTGG